MSLRDDLGAPVPLEAPARRVVSLVPSLTEALAATCPDRLVGATDWCTRPAGLHVARVRGTKNPDLAAVAGLEPDLVVANKEENRELDVRRLRERGVAVWVTDIESVPQALASMRRLFAEGLDVPGPPWLREASEAWAGPVPAPTTRAVVPVWRDPWMVVGRPTFTADLLARLGYEVVGGRGSGRYPGATLEALDDPGLADVVLLPDEPYEFTTTDGPEAFVRVPTRLVSGRLLTWYGPALTESRISLDRA
ncbi:helical backbone metal receptor [Phycicoccus endophyticus]|uniref:helical backbone metal receptor n=1 Tax=Phycicoccus endophyticus TaxID=1690220 RepID=UPI0019A5926B|nr:helical backbone metal receptor [Phycicoccus endophyticus]GGL32225.1 ABC transporter substrate-binding protein [Phycicoccus endophyticus]